MSLSEHTGPNLEFSASFPIGQKTRILLQILASQDPYTHQHSIRVANYAGLIARRLGLSEEKVNNIVIAAQLHDIGKLGLNKAIINKPGHLSKQEFKEMVKHVEIGVSLLRKLKYPEIIVTAIDDHHRRLDGSGYSSLGLDSENPDLPLISLEGSILAVVDSFVAMTDQDRPNGARKTTEQAFSDLANNSGKLYEEEIVKTFISSFSFFDPYSAKDRLSTTYSVNQN